MWSFTLLDYLQGRGTHFLSRPPITTLEGSDFLKDLDSAFLGALYPVKLNKRMHL